MTLSFANACKSTKIKHGGAIDGELWLLKVVGGGQLRSNTESYGQRHQPLYRQPSTSQRASIDVAMATNRRASTSPRYGSHNQPTRSQKGSGLCWELNYKGTCTRPICTFSHACNFCGQTCHGKLACPLASAKNSNNKGQANTAKHITKK